MKGTIKNIIFDLGVVVLNIDYNGPEKMLRQMGFDNFNAYYSKVRQTSLFDDFEKGTITPAAFRLKFKEFTGFTLNDDEIDRIWNTMILDFPKDRMALLIELKKYYNTYLLSNTNKIHYDSYTKQLAHDNGLAWKDLFHKTFFSHEMGLKKPNKEIYQKALSDAGIKADESLFIDDLITNVEAARSCSIHTIWLKDGMDLMDVFERDRLTEVLKPRIELFN